MSPLEPIEPIRKGEEPLAFLVRACEAGYIAVAIPCVVTRAEPEPPPGMTRSPSPLWRQPPREPPRRRVPALATAAWTGTPHAELARDRNPQARAIVAVDACRRMRAWARAHGSEPVE